MIEHFEQDMKLFLSLSLARPKEVGVTALSSWKTLFQGNVYFNFSLIDGPQASVPYVGMDILISIVFSSKWNFGICFGVTSCNLSCHGGKTTCLHFKI